MANRVEVRLLVGRVELVILKEPLGPGMADLGAGPEDSHLVFDPLVGHAEVVGSAALAGYAKLVEDVFGGLEVVEVLAPSEPTCQLQKDACIGSGVSGRVHGRADSVRPALCTGDGALFFLVQRSG